jgi:transcription initiation factor IIE alpha subunit
MVHAKELKNMDMREPEFFINPVCQSPLSLLRRVHEETEELAILVTCEFCDEHHGFVILTGLQKKDL